MNEENYKLRSTEILTHDKKLEEIIVYSVFNMF